MHGQKVLGELSFKRKLFILLFCLKEIVYFSGIWFKIVSFSTEFNIFTYAIALMLINVLLYLCDKEIQIKNFHWNIPAIITVSSVLLRVMLL